MPRVVIVGGPAHGRSVDVDTDPPPRMLNVVVPTYDTHESYTFGGLTPHIIRVPSEERYTYGRMEFAFDDDERVWVYVAENESVDEGAVWDALHTRWVARPSRRATNDMARDLGRELDARIREMLTIDTEPVAATIDVDAWVNPDEVARTCPCSYCRNLRGGRRAWHPEPRQPLVQGDPLGWHRCRGTEQDPHEEVLWEGGPDCWVCGQPGEPAYSPRIKDQEVAPYGWG